MGFVGTSGIRTATSLPPLRFPHHRGAAVRSANRTHRNPPASSCRHDGPSLCCDRPGGGPTHRGESTRGRRRALLRGRPPCPSLRPALAVHTVTSRTIVRGRAFNVNRKPDLPRALGRRLSRRHPAPAARRGNAGLPLLGLSKIVPPPCSIVESTPGRSLSGPTFGSSPAGADRVPPSWFRTTSTVCSSATVSGCCTRLPTMGFAAFRTLAKSSSRDAVPPFRALLPQHRADTGRIRSRRAAVRPRRRVTTPTPLHPRPCPLAVLPWDRACATLRRPRPRGFPLCREPCRHLALPLGADLCSPGLASPPPHDRSRTRPGR